MDPIKILIIDDDLLDFATISQTLLRSGYQTRHAADQKRALKTIREESPDMIICSLDVRNLNARRLVQEVRQSPHLRSTPFLFIGSSRQSAEAAPDILGPKQRLSRPFTREQLTIAVQDHLRLSMLAAKSDRDDAHATEVSTKRLSANKRIPGRSDPHRNN
jgi:PleD family two-component response regulator